MELKRIKNDFLLMCIVLPIALSLVLVVVCYFAVPPFIAWLPTNTDSTDAIVEYDPNEYYLVDYMNFSDLRLNNFVGWLSSDDLGLGCAVTYDSENEFTEAASLSVASTEPWGNNGALLITGENTDYEFRNLHKAQIGDRVTIDFNGHASYTYEIVEITTKETRQETYAHMNDKTLVMCLSYNDFSNYGSSYFYHVYVAQLVE